MYYLSNVMIWYCGNPVLVRDCLVLLPSKEYFLTVVLIFSVSFIPFPSLVRKSKLLGNIVGQVPKCILFNVSCDGCCTWNLVHISRSFSHCQFHCKVVHSSVPWNTMAHLCKRVVSVALCCTVLNKFLSCLIPYL